MWFSWFSKQAARLVVYYIENIHLLKKSLAGVRLFITENTANKGVIEWRTQIDPV